MVVIPSTYAAQRCAEIDMLRASLAARIGRIHQTVSFPLRTHTLHSRVLVLPTGLGTVTLVLPPPPPPPPLTLLLLPPLTRT